MRTRKVERKRTEITGQCCTNQGRLFDITVCDLTDGGCRFRDAEESLFPGAPVNLMIAGSGPYACFVRWREDKQVGVSFARPLSPALLDQLLNGKPVAPSPTAEADATAPEAPGGTLGPMRRVC